jgi:hypothetical protein
VLEYDADGAERYAQQIVDEGLDPLAGLDAISEAMQVVGEGYASRELWLPEDKEEALDRILEDTRKYYKKKGLI